MSPRIPDTHAEAWSLLPWLANGRIAPEDREWVETHVSACAECRAELAAQRMIATRIQRGGVSPAPAASDEQRSFNKLWARIEASESAATPVADVRSMHGSRRSSRTVRWLAAAVIVQAIGLGALGLALRGTDAGADSQSDQFSTVTDVDARVNAPAVRLVFAPQTSIATINTLLTHQGLKIVAGPGREGNFTAQLSADAVASGASADSVAAVMSKDPNVSLAEPVAP
ncbi:MAG: zf-HC2 domain-containing protein [Pseudomonadota bacterium]